MPDTIDEIRPALAEKIDVSEKNELQVLQEAVKTTLTTYEKEPTAAAKRNWDAAREGLAAAIERLEEKYFSKDKTLKNRLAVVKYLAAQGYKAKRQKVYDDAAAGLLQVQRDGSVRLNDVVAYIALAGLKRIKSAEGELDDLHKQEKQLQIECLRVKRDRENFNFEKDQGNYVLTADHEIQMAALAGLMETVTRQALRFIIEDTIVFSGGSTKKLQVCMDKANLRLDETYSVLVADGEFKIIFDGRDL